MYNRYVIISHNEDKTYSQFRPITEWCWNQIGWNVITLTPPDNIGIRSATYSQLQRLWGWKTVQLFNPKALVMTGDIDMIPLSDYWNPKHDELTVYGHDLTGFNHYPICYIAMNCETWSKVVHPTMAEAIQTLPKIKSDKWEEWWQVDQDYIRERINAYEQHNPITRINRGLEPTGMPLGRVDRYNWSLPVTAKIDSHLLRPLTQGNNFERIYTLIESTYGTSASWMKEYYTKIK